MIPKSRRNSDTFDDWYHPGSVVVAGLESLRPDVACQEMSIRIQRCFHSHHRRCSVSIVSEWPIVVSYFHGTWRQIVVPPSFQNNKTSGHNCIICRNHEINGLVIIYCREKWPPWQMVFMEWMKEINKWWYTDPLVFSYLPRVPKELEHGSQNG